MIIGITGSFGAGKGTVVEYLVEHKGFKHYSARAHIIAEIEKRGGPINRDSMIEVANDLRTKHGATFIIESLYDLALRGGGHAIVESIREVLGAHFIKEQGGFVLGVDADPHIRYQRAMRRGSETDGVSFEKWLEQEQKETNPDDPTKQDIFGALRESDYIVMNNGTIERLHAEIDRLCQKLGI